MDNLRKHIENLRGFNIPVVVALNVFSTDTDAEKEMVRKACEECGAEFAYSYAHAQGGKGAVELAEKVVAACELPSEIRFTYNLDDSIENKIKALAETIYGASGVQYTAAARKTIEEINALGASSLPICVAKTQYSLSDDPKLLCRPKNFEITVRDLKLSSGAGFIVVYLGDILTMPGLPKVPAANAIDIDNDGNIVGLF